ncbi:YncE family protein [Rhodanobacter denitrificans]|uniref:YncE family protein n=1 Tax=Rhodanobacteraceae TaxID=1775411 RepID=UPI000260D08A|nr:MULTISPECIES: YncE family protein [Rhodanobacteraceae]EIM04303.1 YVTN beta-propeller repeat-containing protein [Rhodanobacter denitrificans]MCX7515241.1 YncE family protein [Frateuria sp. STR12]UJM89011.1 YncE family protein [Rhodanobacter denitrificans]
MHRASLGTLASAALVLLPLSLPAAHSATAPSQPYRVLSRMPMPGDGGWDYLTFDAAHRHLYVSHQDRVLVVDVDRHKLLGTIEGTPGAHGIAIDPERGRGFTSNGRADSVTVFDLASLKTLATVKGTGANPDAILYDPASHHVFTFNGKGHSASVIDPSGPIVKATIPLPGKPEFAVSDEAGHVFANIEDKSELVRLDSLHDKVTAVWNLSPCTSPSGLAIDRKHHRLFAVCENRTMAIVSTDSGKVVATVPIGEGPDAVAFDPDTAVAYSSNGQSGTITAVHEDDPGHYSVVATIPTQVSARTLALDPLHGRLYLSAATWAKESQAGMRRTVVPGSFSLLTVGKP